jgi:hypothetical protein
VCWGPLLLLPLLLVRLLLLLQLLALAEAALKGLLAAMQIPPPHQLLSLLLSCFGQQTLVLWVQ